MNQSRGSARRLVGAALAGLVVLSVTRTLAGAAKSANSTSNVIDAIKKFDDCVIQSTFSYLTPGSYPPKTMQDMRTLCSAQQEAFKCIKEKTRGAPGILRRGLLSYVSAQQKHHRKYCTNLDSEATKKFVQDTKCIMEKRFEVYKALDEDYALHLYELARSSFNDARLELQLFCCLTNKLKRSYPPAVGAECAASLDTVTEMAERVISKDIEIICDDDEKLAKICPKLPRLKPPAAMPKSIMSASALGLYLIATLGEPRDASLLG